MSDFLGQPCDLCDVEHLVWETVNAVQLRDEDEEVTALSARTRPDLLGRADRKAGVPILMITKRASTTEILACRA